MEGNKKGAKTTQFNDLNLSFHSPSLPDLLLQTSSFSSCSSSTSLLLFLLLLLLLLLLPFLLLLLLLLLLVYYCIILWTTMSSMLPFFIWLLLCSKCLVHKPMLSLTGGSCRPLILDSLVQSRLWMCLRVSELHYNILQRVLGIYIIVTLAITYQPYFVGGLRCGGSISVNN